MDTHTLINNLIIELFYPGQFDEAVMLRLIILKHIPTDCPKLETNYKCYLQDIYNSLAGIVSPADLYQLMLKFDFGGVKMDRFIIEEPLFAHDYPKTDPLGFYDHLCRKIEEFVSRSYGELMSHEMFDVVVNLIFKNIYRELKVFRPFFKAISYQRKEWFDNNDIVRVMTWITSLAYELEYILHSFVSGQCPRLVSAIWLDKVLRRLPEKNSKDMVRRIIKDNRLSMEVWSKELVINYVVSTDSHQIIPIINYDNEGIGETLRQMFIDEKFVSSFDVCKWSLAGLPDSPHLLQLYETQLQQPSEYGSGNQSKVVKEYSMTLSPEEFKELVDELQAWKQKFFVIFENVTSELQFKLLKELIQKSPTDKASKILYTTRKAEVASKCSLNCSKIFYIPFKINNNTSDVSIDREVVGFNREKEEMLNRLIRGDVARGVISISGMPGLGKTTLAKLLYKHPSVTQHFHVQAFCTVSQAYKSRELLLQLVRHFFPTTHSLHGLEDSDLANTIKKFLMRKRYLIVLDDIWEIDAWKDIMKCFPDDKNGSRIVITTRQTELMPSNIQPVNLLSDVECWELLEKELFQNQNCPEELTTIGKAIARNCKGLPLSVILIAGFLKKLDRTKAAWKEIAETLASALDNDVEAHRNGIMELSYKHLPDCLQPCFLYFGIFPEDSKIPAEKLIRLWSAEGFLFQKVGKNIRSAEDVAANYLTDLVGRSLVSVAEKNLSGRVKSYQVHDLVREFCITKAQEENFFLRLSGYKELSAYSHSLIENNHEFNKLPIPSGPRRLAINCERKEFVETKLITLPLVRSMLFLADERDKSRNNSYNVSFIYDDFKLLKILDLEDIILGDSSLPLIFELVLLTYLAIQCDADHIPEAVSKLWNLETLIFKSSDADKVIQVPDSLWDMTKLRHVHISGEPNFDLDPKRVQNISSAVPKNLQTFSTPSLSTGGKLEKVLPRLQSVRKLKCIFSDQSADVEENGQFPVLDFLSNLESLKVVYRMKRNPEYTSGELKFPEYLTKLSLSNFCLPWKEISQLTKLKVLEVLKIQSKAFKGATWDMSEGLEAFENLKVLKLDTLDIVKWCGVREEHFPKLNHLLLCNLESLEKIPDIIGEIDTLEMIDVKWCSSSTEESAKGIKEKIWDEYGNEINIIIHSNVTEMG